MMRLLIRFFLSLAVVWSARVTAEDVTWFADNSPPIFIYDGPHAGHGAGDLGMAYLFAHLPHYRHRVAHADVTRIFHEMSQRDAICYCSALADPTQDTHLRFSARPIVVPGYRLIILPHRRADFAPYLTADGRVDLAALSANPKLTGAYLQSLRYDEVIQRFIDDPKRAAKLDVTMETKQLSALLHAGRLDFYLATGIDVLFYATDFPHQPQPLALSIKGSASSIPAHIACSNQLVGRAVIADIDQWLANDQHWAAFVAPLKSWLDPKDFAITLKGDDHPG